MPSTLADVAPAFVAMAHRIVWCSVATVDARKRPRSRILHPIWQWEDGELTGWIATGPTPLKRAHLDNSPHVSCNYWTENHDTCVAECQAEWQFRPGRPRAAYGTCSSRRRRQSATTRRSSPAWEGPDSPAFAVLRFEPVATPRHARHRNADRPGRSTHLDRPLTNQPRPSRGSPRSQSQKSRFGGIPGPRPDRRPLGDGAILGLLRQAPRGCPSRLPQRPSAATRRRSLHPRIRAPFPTGLPSSVRDKNFLKRLTVDLRGKTLTLARLRDGTGATHDPLTLFLGRWPREQHLVTEYIIPDLRLARRDR